MIKECKDKILNEAKNYIEYTKKIGKSKKPYIFKVILLKHRYRKTVRKVKRYVSSFGRPIIHTTKAAKALFDDCLSFFTNI